MPVASLKPITNIGNAWHIPRNVEPPGTMRDPVTSISPGSSVLIFSGNQFQGPGNAGDQLETGSTVFFRRASDIGWTALPMRFESFSGNNKYYAAILGTDNLKAGDSIQYYLRIPYSDHLLTFLHGTDEQSFATAKEADAQAAPFSFVVGRPMADVLTLNSGPHEGRVFTRSG